MNKRTLLYPFIILIVLADQWTKMLVYKAMMAGDSHPVIQNILHITYVKNTGAAFSILQGKTGYLMLATGLVLLVTIVYFVSSLKTNHPIVSLALSMIIGGGIGNLLDRWRLSYVVDFIDFRVFPVFNVADIFVTLGCFSLILYLIITEKKNYGKKTD